MLLFSACASLVFKQESLDLKFRIAFVILALFSENFGLMPKLKSGHSGLALNVAECISQWSTLCLDTPVFSFLFHHWLTRFRP